MTSNDKRTLPIPVETLVDQSAPRHAALLWRDLSERRRARRASSGPSLRAALSVAACFAILVSGALALTLGFRAPRDERPLLAADRSALPGQIRATDSYRTLDLSDGSRLTVARGAHLDVLESSPRTVSFALRSGRVRFDVRPRGPRSWRIDCGAFSVEVVGTKFVLERSSAEVSVQVLHGAVLVRGAAIPDGVQRLNAGHGFKTRPSELERARPQALTQLEPIVLPLAQEEEVDGLEADQAERVDEAASPLRAPRRGRTAHPSGNREVDGLFHAADSARLRGRAAEAAAKLSRILEYHADDPRASLAGFALARLQLAALNQPGLAVDNLKLALSLGLPRALLEDAYGKLAEAYEKAGDKNSACLAFSEYRRRFPNGEKASRPPQQCQVDKTQ